MKKKEHIEIVTSLAKIEEHIRMTNGIRDSIVIRLNALEKRVWILGGILASLLSAIDIASHFFTS